MYSSSRKRCPKTKWALKILTAAFLAASPAAKSAANNAYDALIIEARKGNTQPALLWFAQKSALSNNQIADWLQIALWYRERFAIAWGVGPGHGDFFTFQVFQ